MPARICGDAAVKCRVVVDGAVFSSTARCLGLPGGRPLAVGSGIRRRPIREAAVTSVIDRATACAPGARAVAVWCGDVKRPVSMDRNGSGRPLGS